MKRKFVFSTIISIRRLFVSAQKKREDFCLLGAVENPYPYYEQTDIYVQATRFEGKSIAVIYQSLH